MVAAKDGNGPAAPETGADGAAVVVGTPFGRQHHAGHSEAGNRTGSGFRARRGAGPLWKVGQAVPPGSSVSNQRLAEQSSLQHVVRSRRESVGQPVELRLDVRGEGDSRGAEVLLEMRHARR